MNSDTPNPLKTSPNATHPIQMPGNNIEKQPISGDVIRRNGGKDILKFPHKVGN